MKRSRAPNTFDSALPRLQEEFVSATPHRPSRHWILMLAVIVSLFLSSWSVYLISKYHVCSSKVVAHPCMPSSRTNSPSTASVIPTQTPRVYPTPTPTSPPAITPTPTPSATPTPTPSATPIPTAQQVNMIVTHYFELILNQQYQQAYELLSADQQAQEPFSDFVKNPNYTLMPGCWTIDVTIAPQLEPDSETWHMAIEFEYVKYGDNMTITYYWDLHLRMEHGHFVIDAIGLLPTGIEPTVNSPCSVSN